MAAPIVPVPVPVPVPLAVGTSSFVIDLFLRVLQQHVNHHVNVQSSRECSIILQVYGIRPRQVPLSFLSSVISE